MEENPDWVGQLEKEIRSDEDSDVEQNEEEEEDEKEEKKEAERICKLVETRVNLWAKDKSFLELISTVHKLLPRHCPDFSSSDQCVVDAKELRRRYREVLRRVHPD